MDIDPNILRDRREQLSDKNCLAPRQAIAALFALGDPDETVALVEDTPRDGGTTWQIVGRLHGGLSVVSAHAEIDGWGWHPHFDGEVAVEAVWHPIDALDSVSITDVRLWPDRDGDGALSGQNGWAIAIRGRYEPVKLPRDPSERPAGLVDDFCRGLIRARAAADRR